MTDISARLEDYLETILLLSREGGGAHTTDIADRLAVKKPSVTEMLQSLAEKKLVQYQKYMAVTLTEEGEKLALAVRRKHESIRRFLADILCMNAKEADEQACLMEHVLSRNAVDRLVRFTEFIGACPRAGEKWIRGMAYQCDEIDKLNRCKPCIEQCLTDLEESTKMIPQTETILTAAEMRAGERGVVDKIAAQGALKKRLADMGLSKGATLEAVRMAPLGDPIDFKIKGYHLSLRKSEASGIAVKVNRD